ncbi:MAG: haloacid dehalogenase-like hydrolase [Firmicutes bacterium]|nr:haloacid dehalogenase-like hydrolase [Bacillota bacterium]
MKKIIVFFLTICMISCFIFTGCAGKTESAPVLTNWVEGSAPAEALKEYVKVVTDSKSEDFIPVEDRIAVFDLDGTLYCETFPIYGEWILFSDYVLNTPSYEASAELKAVAEELAAIEKASDIPGHMEQTHINAHAKAFAGMTIEDYMDVVEAFKATEAEGFEGMTRGEAFYIPMLEVVDYLLDNDFTVYICSGTNRFTVRSLIDGVIDIPARQVIGTDFTIVASGQGEEMDMHYNYVADDELLMGDTVITKNVKMSKVAQLEQELGQKPVLVFGNSTGDVPMAVYSEEENPYLTKVFFLLCDDLQRERGNESKAQKMADICAEKGWETISMANDWVTIYGDGVSVK